ncbi:MAG: alkaline phosphatase [Tannerella sp.]|jgi:alkaline phosphatase|nr:alkaline phosphatase [Tannerella sp.]
MKKSKIILLLCIFVFAQLAASQAKYIFYFIGDGMGVNYIDATEAYLSSINKERGTGQLLMTTFPVATFITTYSADNDVTDSAAAGTALATGKKSNNGFIGLLPDSSKIISLAEKAKKAGKKVGIASTVPVNHATPASFYAHQPKRSMYYEISQDLITSNFDFFGGAGFYNRNNFYDKTEAPDIYPLIEQAGYYIAKGIDDFKANSKKADKIVLLQKNWEKPEGIPYAIDRKTGDLSLKEITEAAIEVLTRKNNKGFFLMLEGGRIDWAGHGNDGATMVHEVIDMDEAIKVAYDFYKKHPKETLIVITADHETGGLTVGRGSLNLNVLQYQKKSADGLSEQLNELVKNNNGYLSWDDIKNLLTETMGFWDEISISQGNEKKLRDAYEATIAKQKDLKDTNLYAEYALLAATAKEVMNDIARLGWATKSHSANYVPIFAIGAGQEHFTRKMDNTDIPKKIMQIARY